MSSENCCGPILTYKKYYVIAKTVENKRMGTRRRIFLTLRTCKDSNEQTFFPRIGLTAGEFFVWYQLFNNKKRMRKKQDK